MTTMERSPFKARKRDELSLNEKDHWDKAK